MEADADDGPLWLHGVVREPLAGRARRWLGSREDRDRTGAGRGKAARAPGSGTGPGDGSDAAGPGASAAGLDGTRRVRRGGLAAVVSPGEAIGEAAEADARLDRHARVVEALAASGTVVPAPPGLRAPDEAAVLAFLDRGRLALEEALDLFDGACEVRLHVRRHPVRRATDPPPSATVDDGAAGATAAGLYQLLRRQARAARRLPTADGDVLTAAFLVPRAGWSEGTALAARWQERQPGLAAEITGPWAPWDFVRMFPVQDGGAAGDGEETGPAKPAGEGT